MIGMQFEQKGKDSLKTGEFSLFTKTVSATDVTLYAGISADFSPVYMNKPYAEQSRFGRQVAHPMLIGSMAGGAIFRLLSPDAYPVKREFEMMAPVYIGDTVTIRAEIASVDKEQSIVEVAIECYNQKQEMVLRGKSVENMGIIQGDGGRELRSN